MPKKIKKIPFSSEQLKELFYYNPEEGVLYNRITRSSSAKSGSVSGHVFGGGYIHIHVQGRNYLAHRLIWKLVYGTEPVEQIDHINQCRSDNRLENLREVSHGENSRNAKIRIDNTSGFTGVNFHKQKNKWCARIAVNGEEKHLGCYKTFDEAKEARERANIRYGYHENHGNDLIHRDTILPKRISSTGQKNIHFVKSRRRYRVILIVNKKTKYFGEYKNLNDAIIARDEGLKDIELLKEAI